MGSPLPRSYELFYVLIKLISSRNTAERCYPMRRAGLKMECDDQ